MASKLHFPNLMYGTAWKEAQTTKLTKLAIELGFRAIDTANQRKHYFEKGVGDAIADTISRKVVSRKDLFLQTKFTYVGGQDQRLPYDPYADFRTQVRQSFESSLEHLQTDYLDSYLLHGPSQMNGLSDSDFEVWREMEALFEEKKVRMIGVSNFNSEQLIDLLEKSKHMPQFVQNRCFAIHDWDKRIRSICRDNKIYYQGFSLLTANRQVFNDPRVQKIAQKHRATIAQVIFSFARAIDIIPLTGTSDPKHMKEDFTNYKLSDQEIETIESLTH